MTLQLRPNPQGFDALPRAFGFKAWNGDPGVAPLSGAPVAGSIFGSGIYLSAGEVVTNIHHSVAVAGAGTLPTAIFVGLASPTAMLRQSADVKASTAWTTANTLSSIALASPAIAPASGLYYVLFLQVGAWGTTQHTFNRHTVMPAGLPAGLSAALFNTAQTVLPADGASPGTASTDTRRFWVAVS